MHMSDALLSPAMGIIFSAAALAAGAHSVKEIGIKENETHPNIPLIGISAAFIFAAQMINFTIPGTGSSGHLGGGLFLAALLGPSGGFLAIAAILIIQAFLFADGGLLALGANMFNMGVIPCFLVYPLIFSPIIKRWKSGKALLGASLLGAVTALQLGAFSVVLQTLLSGKTELPFFTFVLFMQPIHLAIGIVEGCITAGLLLFIQKHMPRLLAEPQVNPGKKLKILLIVLLSVTLLTGGLFSLFASSHPDGLEWSIERTAGEEGLEEETTFLTQLQELTSLLPDYDFKEKAPGFPLFMGRSFSGVAGSIITFLLMAALIVLLLGVKTLVKSKARD